MKTISKILIAVVVSTFTSIFTVNAQSIQKKQMLTDILDPWALSVTYQADHNDINYYLLSVGNDKYGKKRNGIYIETYRFFGTAKEMIEFLEEIKIAYRLEEGETCKLQSRLAKKGKCFVTKNALHYDTYISTSTAYTGGYSFVMKEKNMEDLILKIQKFENESQGD